MFNSTCWGLPTSPLQLRCCNYPGRNLYYLPWFTIGIAAITAAGKSLPLSVNASIFVWVLSFMYRRLQHTASIYTLHWLPSLLWSIPGILSAAFLLSEWKTTNRSQLLCEPFLIPREAMCLVFSLAFCLYLLLITYIPGFSCLQSRWGVWTNLFALAMETYEGLMCLYLYYVTQGLQHEATRILAYRHTIAIVIAVTLSSVLLLTNLDGESAPIACWQIHDVASTIPRVIQLCTFAVPVLLFNFVITLFLTAKSSYALQLNSYGKYNYYYSFIKHVVLLVPTTCIQSYLNIGC